MSYSFSLYKSWLYWTPSYCPILPSGYPISFLPLYIRLEKRLIRFVGGVPEVIRLNRDSTSPFVRVLYHSWLSLFFILVFRCSSNPRWCFSSAILFGTRRFGSTTLVLVESWRGYAMRIQKRTNSQRPRPVSSPPVFYFWPPFFSFFLFYFLRPFILIIDRGCDSRCVLRSFYFFFLIYIQGSFYNSALTNCSKLLCSIQTLFLFLSIPFVGEDDEEAEETGDEKTREKKKLKNMWTSLLKIGEKIKNNFQIFYKFSLIVFLIFLIYIFT